MGYKSYLKIFSSKLLPSGMGTVLAIFPIQFQDRDRDRDRSFSPKRSKDRSSKNSIFFTTLGCTAGLVGSWPDRQKWGQICYRLSGLLHIVHLLSQKTNDVLQIVFPPQVIFAFIRFVLNVPGIKRIKETCKPVSFATGNQHAYLASLDLCTQDVGFWHLSCYNFRFLNFREVFFDGTWNTFLVRYKVAWYLRESRHGRENQTCRKSCIFLPCHPSYLRFHSIIANVDFFEVFFGVDLDFFWAATRTDHIYHHPSPPLSLSLPSRRHKSHRRFLPFSLPPSFLAR